MHRKDDHDHVPDPIMNKNERSVSETFFIFDFCNSVKLDPFLIFDYLIQIVLIVAKVWSRPASLHLLVPQPSPKVSFIFRTFSYNRQSHVRDSILCRRRELTIPLEIVTC